MLVFSFEAGKSHAIGLDTAVKIVAGSSAQQVVRSIGEKAGMKFTKQSLDATTDYINGQAAKGDVNYVDFAKKANTVATTGTSDSAKPGWKKYILEPAMWLTGADLLVEAYDAFNDGRTNGTDVEVYGKMYENSGFYFDVAIDSQGKKIYQGKHRSGDIVHYSFGFDPAVWKKDRGEIVLVSYTATQAIVDFKVHSTPDGYPERVIASSRKTIDIPDFDATYNGEGVKKRPAVDVDVSDITNMSTTYNTYKNTIDNDDYSKVTYDNDIEIYAPESTNTTVYNDYDTPWNTKMEDDEFTIIVKPIIDVDVVIPPSDDDDSPVVTNPGGDITIIVEDDDDYPIGTRPDAVEVIDRSMLDVARQTYNYLGDSVDTAIDGMRDVTDNATGLISYLDESFDWLPNEWRALFGSAFILGVFAHFFRR